MNAETKKLIQILLIGTCIIKIVSLVLASVVYSRNEEGNNENYNIIWAVIVGLLVVFEITSYIILCQVNDIFKGFITSCDLLSLIYIIYLHRKLSVLARRRALEANLLDVLGENEYPKNPVPPAVDEVEIEEVMS
uniref:Uncharacterized protein n=1 Tax=Rhizophagus irregularis (strain DAOM 181602 / DAOM 197198 / MUCL 43194) TaxID=747089 RepID=U9SW19_RHIID